MIMPALTTERNGNFKLSSRSNYWTVGKWHTYTAVYKNLGDDGEG